MAQAHFETDGCVCCLCDKEGEGHGWARLRRKAASGGRGGESRIGMGWERKRKQRGADRRGLVWTAAIAGRGGRGRVWWLPSFGSGSLMPCGCCLHVCWKWNRIWFESGWRGAGDLEDETRDIKEIYSL